MDNSKSYFQLPDWLTKYEEQIKDTKFNNDEKKMEIAIEISKRNVLRKTGGPFGCAIFKISKDKKYSTLFSVGCNLVLLNNNCTLHGEMVAIQLGQKKIKNYTFEDNDKYELFTSCEPCAMCLGAILWCGVQRLVCGATKYDAEELGFKEGPVFNESYLYLQNNGIEIKKNVLRKEAKGVFILYSNSDGKIYNSK
jgi:tRNA(Arg) A34 adenosine deaminase TadA